jgi:Protein of unknown function (DUF1064)
MGKQNQWTLADLQNIKTPGVVIHGIESDLLDEKPKNSKYGNSKVTLSSGLKFDSEKEAKRYTELRLMENAGEITALQMQVKFKLTASKYYADFTYFDYKKKQFIVEDVKSVATRKLTPFRMKKRMMKELYNIDILET